MINIMTTAHIHDTASSWILAYQRQSVAQRQEDFLYAAVVHHEVVEVFDAGSLAVAALGRFEHMAVPQRVVGKDEANKTETKTALVAKGKFSLDSGKLKEKNCNTAYRT